VVRSKTPTVAPFCIQSVRKADSAFERQVQVGAGYQTLAFESSSSPGPLGSDTCRPILDP
jgi:hypothetical protein